MEFDPPVLACSEKESLISEASRIIGDLLPKGPWPFDGKSFAQIGIDIHGSEEGNLLNCSVHILGEIRWCLCRVQRPPLYLR